MYTWLLLYVIFYFGSDGGRFNRFIIAFSNSAIFALFFNSAQDAGFSLWGSLAIAGLCWSLIMDCSVYKSARKTLEKKARFPKQRQLTKG